jgi:hypothetical protein
MRLVGSFADAPQTGAERRIFPRREVRTRVAGMRLDHSLPARQQPHLSLSLRDLSLGGLSAVTDAPVSAGERVSVYFPPEGLRQGWDAYGRVIRCQPSGVGYRVAVAFDPLPAA